MRTLPRTIALLVVLGGIGSSRALAQEIPGREIDMYALFRVVGTLYDLDPDLLRAIASVESGYNPEAVSPKGARGLMQLMPETARRFRVDDTFDPVENALGAARFLEHIRMSRSAAAGAVGDLAYLLAAYNAGEGAVTQYRGIPPFPETRNYIRRVLFTYLTDGLPPQLKAKLIRPRGGANVTLSPARPPADPIEQLAEIRAEREAALRRTPDAAQAAETR